MSTIAQIRNELSNTINYTFRNDALLEEAITHPSVKKFGNVKDYERLEFLGDSVLNMIVSDMLFNLFPEENEGELTKRKADLVCSRTIASVASDIGLSKYIIMDSGNGWKYNQAILENAFEALVGAVYVDGGLQSCKAFVTRYWEKLVKDNFKDDSKSTLQDWAHKNKVSLPIYKTLKKTGPAHSPVFTVSACVDELGSASASGTTKKSAEQKAAEVLLSRLKNKEEVVVSSSGTNDECSISVKGTKKKPPPPPPAPPPPPPPPPQPPPPSKDEVKKLDLPIVKRVEWEALPPKWEDNSLDLPVKTVVYSCDTDSEPCTTKEDCVREVQEMQKVHMTDKGLSDIAYNFLVGGDGSIYEGRGWDCGFYKSTKFSKLFGGRLDIGFIGKYTPESLPVKMLRTSLFFIYDNINSNNVSPLYQPEIVLSLFSQQSRTYNIKNTVNQNKV